MFGNDNSEVLANSSDVTKFDVAQKELTTAKISGSDLTNEAYQSLVKMAQDLPVSEYSVSTFYKFLPLSGIFAEKNLSHEALLAEIKTHLESAAENNKIKGLIILGLEGFNATVSSIDSNGLAKFKKFICDYFKLPDLFFKDSVSSKAPFRRFKVKLREEIVTLGTPELIPFEESNHHLSPEQWNAVLKNEKDFLLIDTRNWYETKIGTFKGAINPGIDKFTEFPVWMEQNNYPKDKKVLIFCTGGIRCEKGILELQRKGYENVFQLHGGIINYLHEKPQDEFQGECFVFDHRVALDQELKPTQKYGLCPHCGQPSSIQITCKRCDSKELICEDCQPLEFKGETCSKNCAHQYAMNPQIKAGRQVLPFEVEQLVEKGLDAACIPPLHITKTKVLNLS